MFYLGLMTTTMNAEDDDDDGRLAPDDASCIVWAFGFFLILISLLTKYVLGLTTMTTTKANDTPTSGLPRCMFF